jgi:hypothetical protein
MLIKTPSEIYYFGWFFIILQNPKAYKKTSKMPSETQLIVKYTFSGHDSFHCRQLWLMKGFDFVQEGISFNNFDAVVKLGVE